MLRAVRALVLLALVSCLLAAPVRAGAAERSSAAVDNDAARQALLHERWPDDGVPGRVLVTATSAAAASDVAREEGGTMLDDRTVLLEVAPGEEAGVAARLAPDPAVLGIEPDRVRPPAAEPDDPMYDEQWAHVVANAPPAWSRSTGSPSVTVAVLDTGVDGRHPDLKGNLVAQVDVSGGTADDHDGNVGIDNDQCNIGHGTFVSGVVGAVGDNDLGVAGVAWDVSIVDVALTSRSSRCGILDSAIISGLRYAVDEAHADIVNLSLGGVDVACPISLQSALDAARSKGTIVVAAAGNDQRDIPGATSVPASCDGVVSVGAVGETKNIAPYSDQNAYIDLVAPGGDTSNGRGIVSTVPDGKYDEEQGTSFASPYVVGAMAVLLSIDPDLAPGDLESVVERTATDRGAPGPDDVYGYGLINLGAAATAVANGNVPVLDNEREGFPVRGGSLDVQRIAPPSDSTDPVAQAVAMSKRAYDDDQAFHAVVARADDFADALGGSALGFGLGPLLFSSSTGPLAPATAAELQRALPRGSTVYVLGGTAALPSTIEADIRSIGFEPVRLAGTTRQRTSVAIAEELERFLRKNDFDPPEIAMVATAYNWPDAVSAGALGAWFGIPILVTAPGSLEPSIESLLRDRALDRVYVIGGTAAISDATAAAAQRAAALDSSQLIRLAGVDRSGTTIAVSAEFENLFSLAFEQAFGTPATPGIVAAVNLRAPGGFAHVLSASSLLGEFSGVFVPVEGERGDHLTDQAEQYACRFPAAGIVVGGTPLIDQRIVPLLDALLKGSASACQS